MDLRKGSIARDVISYENGSFLTRRRELVDEVHWRIWLNGRQIGRISGSPWELEEAAVGYLYTEGHIHGESCRLTVSEDTGVIAVETGEDAPSEEEAPAEPLKLTAAEVMELAAELEGSSQLFRRTGGVHCAALASGRKLLVRREDVSRHVAVDKVAGACLQRGISMKDKVLVFSGRVPGEILQKAAAMGCAMVIARSAPTDYACRLAEEKDVTLIGFAREDGFNIYTHPERVEP